MTRSKLKQDFTILKDYAHTVQKQITYNTEQVASQHSLPLKYYVLLATLTLLLGILVLSAGQTFPTISRTNSITQNLQRETNLLTWTLTHPTERITLFRESPFLFHDSSNTTLAHSTTSNNQTTKNSLEIFRQKALNLISRGQISKHIIKIANQIIPKTNINISNIKALNIEILNNHNLTQSATLKNSQNYANSFFLMIDRIDYPDILAYDINHSYPNINFPSLTVKTRANIYIPAPIIKQTTEDLPPGKQIVIKQGAPGELQIAMSEILHLTTTLTTRSFTSYKILGYKKPTTSIIKIGAAPHYRTITINNKTIKYYRTLNVWATSYDSNCAGCNNTTATGRHLQYGIIAVDPRIIPLHTCIYVPGYGYGQAEDTGGAIKGNKIDLAFEDVHYGWWSARYVDIYLVDCKDAKLPWNR